MPVIFSNTINNGPGLRTLLMATVIQPIRSRESSKTSHVVLDPIFLINTWTSVVAFRYWPVSTMRVPPVAGTHVGLTPVTLGMTNLNFRDDVNLTLLDVVAHVYSTSTGPSFANVYSLDLLTVQLIVWSSTAVGLSQLWPATVTAVVDRPSAKILWFLTFILTTHDMSRLKSNTSGLKESIASSGLFTSIVDSAVSLFHNFSLFNAWRTSQLYRDSAVNRQPSFFKHHLQ